MFKKIFLAVALIALLSSCYPKTVDIKSPCVSSQDGPCGPRKPVNSWQHQSIES